MYSKSFLFKPNGSRPGLNPALLNKLKASFNDFIKNIIYKKYKKVYLYLPFLYILITLSDLIVRI